MDNITDIFEVVLYALACPFALPIIIEKQEEDKESN